MSKKDDKGRDEHTGSTAAEDSELSLWLNKLWAKNEPPERVELYPVTGPRKDMRGEMIHHEDFRPNEKLNVEQANRLANEILSAAQNDCDSIRKEAWYQLAIIDRNRRANPLTRRIGPLQPKRSYAIAKAGTDFGDDDEEPINAKNLDLEYIKRGFEESRMDKQRNFHILGEVITMLHNDGQSKQAVIERMQAFQLTMFQQLQESMDRALDRELARDKAKFTLNMWSEGIRSAKNLLPGFFGPPEGSGKPPLAGGSNESNGNNGNSAPKKYGASPERALVDNFLNDCEQAKIDIALFGNFEEQDGKLVQVAQGVFSLEQFRILWRVREGHDPVDALDALMPGTKSPLAITEDQINKSMAAGMTMGIGMAMREVFNLRKQAMDAKEAAANGTVTNGASEKPEETTQQ